jgi:hypothetical protein
MKRLVFVLVAAGAAWGDVPPADSIGCRDKIAGASCKRDDGSEGACATSTCSRHDYSNGPPPKTVQYDCLKCAAAAAAPAPPAEKKTSCATVPSETVLGLLTIAFLRRRRA